MMNLKHLFLIQSFIVLTEQYSSTEITSSCNYSTLENLLYALYKNVKFMETKKNQLNIDAAYGLTLTEANLISIAASRRIKYLDEDLRLLVSEIRQLSNKTRDYVGGHLLTDRDRKFAEVFMNVDLWLRSITWKNATLLKTRLADPTLIGSRAYDFMTSGTPKEIESDSCLLQLINEYLERGTCKLSKDCAKMLLRDDNSRGYALTHRLLMIQVTIVLNCEDPEEEINVKELIGEYCGEIWQDLQDMEASNFPLVGEDLAMEEMFVCGIEGYLEFLTDHYRELVLSWPNSVGCFSSRGFTSRYHRRKRSSNLMDYGCDSHTCGVAAATLSLLIRQCLQDVNVN